MSLVAKQLVDVAASALALIVLSPIFALIAVAILIRDGRPILFRQTRVGLHGRSFRVVKFRTMVRDAEARLTELEALNELRGHAFKVTNDPRLTRTGRFLRRTSLDELPQLWNVLRGDMGLVGPRPAAPGQLGDYTAEQRRVRASVRPGITGLAQVSGRSSLGLEEAIAFDLWYATHASVWTDLKILARTLSVVVGRRGTN